MPVKRLQAAKSRLRGALPGVPHEELALALAADTLRAARACPAVAGSPMARQLTWYSFSLSRSIHPFLMAIF
ncbi:hypothetical protein ABTW80_28055, partial [Micromonospora chalcea]